MEGVPRIPMVSFPMRRSADTPNFKSRLKSYISTAYNEDPESYGTEIHEMESLRASAVHVSKDYSGCSTLKKYFCQLNFLKSRFPMNEGGSCAISFSWYDVFSDNVHGWSDVEFEMSCILFNIGALHSELGALDNRQTAEGMKTSCTHFQCAAWAFSHLRHNYQKFFTPDVSPDMLNILMNICLAQAQECILEKSLIDNRKSTITAKVALQIVEYYSTALRTIDGMLKDASQYSDKLIKAVKKWRKLVELKVHYYGCIAYLYRGMQAEDQGKWGERVTMYKAAAEKLIECSKLGKNMEKTDPIHDTLHFTLDVVGGKVAIAEKENEFIYHEKVPELEAVMSDVKAVSLVKGIQFKFDDPQVAGPDIFGRLVPMEAHEHSSVYSEEKAKVLRNYSKRIEEKNEALDKFVIPLQLEQLELHDSEKIPQELIDCCAALSVNQDAVKRLSDLMAKLSSLFHDVEANLEEIQDHLTDQEKREKEYQEVVGKRPPNNIINEITREFQKYQSAQAVAAESNKTLHEAMVVHVANLTILMKPLDEVMKHIPKYEELEKNEEALERMKKLSGKVGEMRKQREMLESQLRDSILNDDITKSLVVRKDEDLDKVFKEELQKHDKITQLLDQNLLAQENIIRALTEANAEYAETRRATVDLKKKRDKVIQSFLNSYEAYDELTAKCNKGIEFYVKLNTNVEKLLQRVRSVCKVQNEERDSNMERIIRKSQAPLPVAPVPSTMTYNNMPGYNYPVSVPATPSYPSTPTSTSSTPRPAGGHLKLKDYLAMKKEGQTAAELAASMHGAGTAPVPSYDSTGQLTHPMVSSTPPPVNPAFHQADAAYNPGYNNDTSLNIGVRPAPVGSEDVGKDSACNYSYQPHHIPQQQQPFNNYNIPSVVNAPPPSATNYYSSAGFNPPTAFPNTSAYSSPSPYGQGMSNSQPTAPPQQQPHNYTQQAPIQTQISQPPSQQNHNLMNQQPPSTHLNHPHTAAASTAYTPNQPGYNPISTMNTSLYSSPVYSSGQFSLAGGSKPTQMGNTYSTAYGVPLASTYSGASYPTSNTGVPNPAPVSQQQYSLPDSTPPPAVSTPPANNTQHGNQNQYVDNSAHYSSVYHPTANTATNATYSTGTTSTPTATGNEISSNAAAAPPQSQLSAATSDANASYSQTSFLAQYVRQNQGYLSSKTPQQATTSTFPSSVNYSTDSSGYAQPQQQHGYVQPASPYGQQQNQYSNHNQDSVVNSNYNQQQQWQHTQQVDPSGVHQSQDASLSHQQSQYPNPSASHPQQQQQSDGQQYQYGALQPLQYQQGYSQLQQTPSNYYSNAGMHPAGSQIQPQHGNTSYANAYHQQPPQPVTQQTTSQPAVVAAAPQTQPKPVANSNLDLLSDIDFNALPAVEPLAPVVLPPGSSSPSHAATNNSSTNSQEQQIDSSLPSSSSSSYIPPIPSSISTTSVQLPSLPGNSNSKFSERKGPSSVDPFQDLLTLEKFTFEVEKLENTVEGLAKKSLNGPTTRLDMKWKDLVDIQNTVSLKRSISVARCYPMKNRFPDILPYDQTRVPIPNTKDDYINASFVSDLSATAYPLIATQAPLPSTIADFWHMIWHHHIELVVCLSNDSDLKNQIYWPNDKGTSLEYGALKIVLQTKNSKQHFIERILTISDRDLKQSRVVVHLQFDGWAGHTFPVSPGPLIGFIKEVSNYYQQQRNLNHPVVVHCIPGVGKTGVFCVLSSAIQEINSGHGIPDIVQIASSASEQRKGIMNDKEYLRFTYHSLLYFCQDILMKRGILSTKPTFEEKPKKSHIRHPSQDFLQEISFTKLLDKVNISDSSNTGSKESSLIMPEGSSNSKDLSPETSVKSSQPQLHMPPQQFSGLEVKKAKLSYTDVPESLTNIDPATFQANKAGTSTDELISDKKQAFEDNKGALFEKTESKTGDPLSSLDPLWSLKK